MNMKERLANSLLNPAYIAQYSLRRCICSYIPTLQLAGSEVLLDVGCGSRPYESIFCSRGIAKYIGIDVEDSGRSPKLKKPDIFYNGDTFPLAEASVDVVLCTQVLEHVPTPAKLLSECSRVLKPGGYLLLTVPFCWEEHETPYDYCRWSAFGLTRLIGEADLQIVNIQRTCGAVEAMAQVLSSYVCIQIGGKAPRFISLLLRCLMFVVQFAAMIAQKVLPKGEIYLDNAVLARKGR